MNDNTIRLTFNLVASGGLSVSLLGQDMSNDEIAESILAAASELLVMLEMSPSCECGQCSTWSGDDDRIASAFHVHLHDARRRVMARQPSVEQLYQKEEIN